MNLELTKMNQIQTIFFLITFPLAVACIKKDDSEYKSCELHHNAPMVLIADSVLYEREDLLLKVVNAHDLGINAEYGWQFADMSNYSVQGGYGYMCSIEESTFLIPKVSFRDEGNYIFTAARNDCGVFTAQKYIKVKALPCPCFDDYSPNSIHVRDSATGLEETSTGIVYTNSLYLVQFVSSEYDLDIDFDYTPQKNSTFYLRNIYPDSLDNTFYDNIYEQARINFIENIYDAQSYRMIAMSEDIYVKRDGNQLTFTLCDVRFKYGNKVKYVSGKFIKNL